MENPAPWLEALGGGLPAVVIVGQAFIMLKMWNRITELMDKIITMSGDQQRVMSDLTTAIKESLGRNK